MQKFIKAGTLIAMLLVPALIFIFLRGFGENHYSLPRFIPVIDSTTGDPMKHTVSIRGKEVQDTIFSTIPDFKLTDQDGKSVNLNLVKNKIHIADFIFTRCPSQCPLMSKQMQRVQESFEKNPEVVILSYTVDPEHDSTSVLKEYANLNGAIKGKWYFLTGEKKEIYRMALNGYYVTAKEQNVDSPDLENKFVHSDKMVLVDSEGIIRGFYNGTDKEEVDRLILETKILLHELK